MLFLPELVKWEEAVLELLLNISVIMWGKPSWKEHLRYKKVEVERRNEAAKGGTERSDVSWDSASRCSPLLITPWIFQLPKTVKIALSFLFLLT